MKSNGSKVPVKPAIAVIIILILLFSLVIIFIWGIINRSDYFRIKEVIIKDGEAVIAQDLALASDDNPWAGLFYLKGRGIFSVDLKKEKYRIAGLYPGYGKVKLIKVLPNRLFVEFAKRAPLGIVKLSRYFYIDKEMVLFEVSGQDVPVLPLIIGAEKKIPRPKTGVRYNMRELELALNIIEGINNSQPLNGYLIKTINIANQGSLSCVMSDDVELKFTDDNIKEKIGILSDLIPQVKNDLGNIKYIDLRFKEPVIKFRDEAKERR